LASRPDFIGYNILFFRKTLPIFRQSEAAECGLACVGMVASYWGKEYDLPALRRKFPITLQGAALNDLIRVSKNLGLTTRALKVEMGALPEISLPAIIHWEFNHFVVLSKIGKNYVIIHDPALGQRRISLPELSKSFTGVVLELRPDADFQKEKVKSRISLYKFFSQVRGLLTPLIQILVFSILIQFAAIVMPFLTQMAIDNVAPTNDLELLKVLALGFGVIFALRPFIEWLRNRLIIYVSTQFSSQLTSNLIRYLFSLPLPYFEKRSIGDLLTRLEASDRLRDLLTQGFVSAFVDVLLGIVTLAMMFYYATKLGFVILITTALVLIIRLFFIPNLRMLVNETLQKSGREQAELIESLRGISSIKFAQKEAEREAIWNNSFTSFINSAAELEANQANYLFLRDLILNIGLVVVIYMGIRQVIDVNSGFTLGAFFAFAAYRDLFFQRLGSFLEQLVEFSMSRVHLERLTEIISEDPEQEPSEYFQYKPEDITLELANVGYRFGEDKELIFNDVSVSVSSGQRIMIFGPSGTGKTTLLKVLSGVYPPSTGIVRLNGTDVQAAGLRYLRSNVAAVLQSDYLFKGSVIDNITFFDRIPDFEFAMQCSQIACVHDEIMQLPMSYESLVGEMGTSLSQGQQQRVLLARALYQKKPILLLDEGTAHLDEENESKVLSNLKSLGVIMVMTAHKSSLKSFATSIWTIDNNGCVSISDE
jgi:ATP-binding cassette subfamily B protein RaxB